MSQSSKMVPCSHCGQEIAASAKVCPHCGGKNKKPFYKRPWFLILVVLVLLVCLVSRCGGNTEEESKKVGEVEQTTGTAETEEKSENSEIDGISEGAKEEKQKTETEAETTAKVQEIYKVGDILHDGNMDIVYVSSGEYTEDNQFLQPAEGKKYIFLDLAFINTSDKSDAGVSLYSFECYADGYAVDAYYGGDDSLSATLSPGRKTEGQVYFEIPADAKEVEVEYETNFLTEEKIKFAFEGDKDSGYVLEKDTGKTEGALKPGETYQGKKMNLTFLSCFADESDNMFITPKEGYGYVTCEIEVENISDSDATITCYSFDCYADGVDCDGAYFRDDELSATISAGRKAKGTVTFEVPKDCETVEVEYLTNVWTSDRIVLDASEYSK